MKHLKQNLAGVENMTTPPDAMFVVDSHNEAIAVREARRMGVPVVGVVDTNSDPDQVDWVIPGNDDALRAIRLFTTKIAEAVIEGRSAFEQTQTGRRKGCVGRSRRRRRGGRLRGYQRLRVVREAGRRFPGSGRRRGTAGNSGWKLPADADSG